MSDIFMNQVYHCKSSCILRTVWGSKFKGHLLIIAIINKDAFCEIKHNTQINSGNYFEKIIFRSNKGRCVEKRKKANLDNKQSKRYSC